MAKEVSVVRKIIGAIAAALICGALGAFILWRFHTNVGLIVGGSLVMLAVAIALPTPLHLGVVVLKDNITLIGPAIGDAVRMGRRKTDPVVEVPVEPVTPALPLGADVEEPGP
jgi:hypothetical protein